jgi:polyisoprenoid-binding protein YceI
MSTDTITTAVPTGTWTVDPAHSQVGFAVKHMGIATVRGQFGSFEGTLELGDDLAGSRIRGTVEVASIDTGEPQRDAHLRSADFFDAERHPQLTFESTAIEAGDGGDFRITGNLTMHGVTRELVLEAEVTGVDVDPWGNERVGLEATGRLSRGDYGMSFNQALGSGNLLVSDRVTLALDVSAIRRAS